MRKSEMQKLVDREGVAVDVYIGKRIKEFRERAGLTVYRLAELFYGNTPFNKYGETVHNILYAVREEKETDSLPASGELRLEYKAWELSHLQVTHGTKKNISSLWSKVENGWFAHEGDSTLSFRFHDFAALGKIASILGVSLDGLLHGTVEEGKAFYHKFDFDVDTNAPVWINGVVAVAREHAQKGSSVLCSTVGPFYGIPIEEDVDRGARLYLNSYGELTTPDDMTGGDTVENCPYVGLALSDTYGGTVDILLGE